MMSSSASTDHKLHLVSSAMGGPHHQQDCQIGNSVSSPAGHLLTPLSGVQAPGSAISYSATGYIWPQANGQSPNGTNGGPHSAYGLPPTPSSSYHQHHHHPHQHAQQQHQRAQQLYSPVSDAGAAGGSVSGPGHDGTHDSSSLLHTYDMSAAAAAAAAAAPYPVTSAVSMSTLARTRSNLNLHQTQQQQQQQQSSPTVHSPSDFALPRSAAAPAGGYYPQHSMSPHHAAAAVAAAAVSPFAYPSTAPGAQQSHLYGGRSFTYPMAGQLPSPHPGNLNTTGMGTSAGGHGVMVSPYGTPTSATLASMGHHHPLQPLYNHHSHHPHRPPLHPFSGPQSQAQQMQDRPFKCNECPQSFNRNHDLKRHKRIHLDVKPFPCGHCDKSFSRKDALKRHILVKGCGKNGGSGDTAPASASSVAGTEATSPTGSTSSTPASSLGGAKAGRVNLPRDRVSTGPSVGTPSTSTKGHSGAGSGPSGNTNGSPAFMTIMTTNSHPQQLQDSVSVTSTSASSKLSPNSAATPHSFTTSPFSADHLYPLRSSALTSPSGAAAGRGATTSPLSGMSLSSSMPPPPLTPSHSHSSLSHPHSNPHTGPHGHASLAHSQARSSPRGYQQSPYGHSALPPPPPSSLGNGASNGNGTGNGNGGDGNVGPFGPHDNIDPQVMAAAAGVE